jgi:hypothetical protein
MVEIRHSYGTYISTDIVLKSRAPFLIPTHVWNKNEMVLLCRMELLFWNPFTSEQEVQDQDWYRSIAAYGLDSGSGLRPPVIFLWEHVNRTVKV